MPGLKNPLTALEVKNFKSPGRHAVGDGLYLVIAPSGGRNWVLRVQDGGRRRDFGLGSAKKRQVSLSEARDAAEEIRRKIRQGIDPVAERQKSREVIPTFEEAARKVHTENFPTWDNKKHAAQWISTLENHAFPFLGIKPVDQIEGRDIHDVLLKIWLEIPETARRVRQRIGTVLDWAEAKGYRAASMDMRRITRGLPRQPKATGHFAAMHHVEVPNFLTNLRNMADVTISVRSAFEFLILTAARSGEIRGALWSEIDLGTMTWTIPSERMKGREEHRVPLSGRAAEILERMATIQRQIDDDALVFEGAKSRKPMSDMALTQLLRRNDIKATAHGFRSSFRDWAAECTNYPREIVEKALAHKLESKVEAAYQRSDLLEKRRPLMDVWARYCCPAVGNVVTLSRTSSG